VLNKSVFAAFNSFLPLPKTVCRWYACTPLSGIPPASPIESAAAVGQKPSAKDLRDKWQKIDQILREHFGDEGVAHAKPRQSNRRQAQKSRATRKEKPAARFKELALTALELGVSCRRCAVIQCEERKLARETFLRELQLSDPKAYEQKLRMRKQNEKRRALVKEATAMVDLADEKMTIEAEADVEAATTVTSESKPSLDSTVANLKS